jgi:hypothetical protein
MRKIIKIKSKKLAKANYGMAVTDDKKKTVANEKKTTFVGTGTQAIWTKESSDKAKSKYPQFAKSIDEALKKQNARDQAQADAAIARANVANKKTGGSIYKKGGPVKKK